MQSLWSMNDDKFAINRRVRLSLIQYHRQRMARITQATLLANRLFLLLLRLMRLSLALEGIRGG